MRDAATLTAAIIAMLAFLGGIVAAAVGYFGLALVAAIVVSVSIPTAILLAGW